MKEILMYYQIHTGDLRTIEWNPCGCCPMSTIEEISKYKRFAYFYKNKRQFFILLLLCSYCKGMLKFLVLKNYTDFILRKSKSE